MQFFKRQAVIWLFILAACGGGAKGAGSPLAPAPPPPDLEPMAAQFYVDPNSQAAVWVREQGSHRPQDAALMRKIADQPMAVWLTNDNAPADAGSILRGAAGAAVVFVAYHIPNRDCGGHSGGGAATNERYRAWLASLTGSMRGSTLIWEPDALGHDCGAERAALAKAAVEFAAMNRVLLYLDAGHPDWHSPDEIAKRLAAAGVAGARGFSLNVSNFVETDRAVQYGNAVVSILVSRHNARDMHFVVDTSRNGNGPYSGADGWCNPPGRALGDKPAAVKSGALDALLWIKRPGESDGECRGGPRAGLFWPEYALGLAKNAKW